MHISVYNPHIPAITQKMKISAAEITSAEFIHLV